MRGLKRSSANILKKKTESHLLQMRGLKRQAAEMPTSDIVASFTDAWIETSMPKEEVKKWMSHLLQMRGLKLKELE